MELKARQVLKIKEISKGNKYNVEEGHPFYGKTFNNYQYNGIAFSVRSDDEFVIWRDQGILFSVDLKEGKRMKEVDGQEIEVDSLQLVGCTNLNAEIAMAKGEATLDRIYRDATSTEVNDDVLAELK